MPCHRCHAEIPEHLVSRAVNVSIRAGYCTHIFRDRDRAEVRVPVVAREGRQLVLSVGA